MHATKEREKEREASSQELICLALPSLVAYIACTIYVEYYTVRRIGAVLQKVVVVGVTTGNVVVPATSTADQPKKPFWEFPPVM